MVAIRDGKTATETVRQSVSNGTLNGELAAEDGHEEVEEEVFEELVVLDSAGRLQVPKEYLEYFEIRGRARLELIEDGILIMPAPQSAQAQAADLAVSDLGPTHEGHGLGVLLGLPGLMRTLSGSVSKAREQLAGLGRRRRSDARPERSRREHEEE